MMENDCISDIPYSLFSKIQQILDIPSTMNLFLEVVPPDCSCENVRTSMAIEGMKYNMTPAKHLLQFLGSKGYTVSHLIQWFEAINLEKALVLLKRDDNLRIIEHPLEIVRLREGENLKLVCRASSYPPADYQWFKNEEDLLLQVDPVLFIKGVRVDASGIYVCLVSKWNSEKNSYDYVYSEPSYVEIIPADLHAFPPDTCPQPTIQNFLFLRDKLLSDITTSKGEMPTCSTKPCFANPIFRNQSEASSDKELITITKHPFIDGKVGQGMSICLHCEVACSASVNFQWIQDGKVLEGKNSNTLMLTNLYPDLVTGKMKWEYQCAVYNNYQTVFSKVAILELKEVNDTTPLFATEKLAFLVANDSYDNLENLLKPAADVTVLAKLLSAMKFKIIACRNLTLAEMRNAFTVFCKMLKPGSYALFSFSGHGFDMYGQTYLQPVDCSENILHQEAVCTEYILQCMQETNPALNILLIDACRKLPPRIREKSKLPDTPGKIFQAKMKNNTVYGYSTSFLCASHESDSEENSVFVKHLKKYLSFDKSIEEILFMVKKEFYKDPIIKDIQFPVIKSSLALPRKLSDDIHDSSLSEVPSPCLQWCDIKRDVISKLFNFESLHIKVTAEFYHHKEVFCNGFDVFLYLHLFPGVNLIIIKDIEINLAFNSAVLHVEPSSGILLNTKKLCIGMRDLLFKKEVCNLQEVETHQLEAKLILKFCSKSFVQDIPFCIDISELSELRLSTNR